MIQRTPNLTGGICTQRDVAVRSKLLYIVPPLGTCIGTYLTPRITELGICKYLAYAFLDKRFFRKPPSQGERREQAKPFSTGKLLGTSIRDIHFRKVTLFPVVGDTPHPVFIVVRETHILGIVLRVPFVIDFTVDQSKRTYIMIVERSIISNRKFIIETTRIGIQSVPHSHTGRQRHRFGSRKPFIFYHRIGDGPIGIDHRIGIIIDSVIPDNGF